MAQRTAAPASAPINDFIDTPEEKLVTCLRLQPLHQCRGRVGCCLRAGCIAFLTAELCANAAVAETLNAAASVDIFRTVEIRDIESPPNSSCEIGLQQLIGNGLCAGLGAVFVHGVAAFGPGHTNAADRIAMPDD